MQISSKVKNENRAAAETSIDRVVHIEPSPTSLLFNSNFLFTRILYQIALSGN
jgi:hypothetical protein